ASVLLAVVAACCAGVRGPGRLARGLSLSVAAAVSAFALLSPYSFLAYRVALTYVAMESLKVVGPHVSSLSLATLVPLGMGWGMALLALVGVVAMFRRAPRPAIVALAFPVAHLSVLALSSTLSARYLVLLTPFVAIFA